MVGHSRRCTTRESTFTACFLPLFALFPRWDRTGCLKQWELDKGRERKTILWSANRKFQTPPPIFTNPYSGFDPYSGFEPPPPPVGDWPLFRVDPYSGFYSTDRPPASPGQSFPCDASLASPKSSQQQCNLGIVITAVINVVQRKNKKRCSARWNKGKVVSCFL